MGSGLAHQPLYWGGGFQQPLKPACASCMQALSSLPVWQLYAVGLVIFSLAHVCQASVEDDGTRSICGVYFKTKQKSRGKLLHPNILAHTRTQERGKARLVTRDQQALEHDQTPLPHRPRPPPPPRLRNPPSFQQGLVWQIYATQKADIGSPV